MDDFGFSGVSKLDVEWEFFKGVEFVDILYVDFISIVLGL